MCRASRGASANSAASPPPRRPKRIVLAPGNGLPTLRIAPFVVLGTPDTQLIAAEALGKIAEVFALFDIANVTMAAPPEGRPDYRLDGTVEYRGDQTVDLRFKLVDESDATVIWSRAFEKMSGKDDDGIERQLILQLANALVQPFGVIWARDRGRQLAMLGGDPRYVCMIDAAEVIKSFDPAGNARIRATAGAADRDRSRFCDRVPMLAALYAREYLSGFGARPGDAPPLDRALKAARRGIELRPQSARAYHILFSVLFLRGEKDAGIAAAEKAIALNPYDLLIAIEYGGRLIYCGEVDRGMAILHESVGRWSVLPSWSHFGMFVGNYVRGELAEARYHASQLTHETYSYGQLARALVAHADGNAVETRRAVKALLALQPSWGEDPRREIGKLVKAPALADRLAGDLLATGYLPSSPSGARKGA